MALVVPNSSELTICDLIVASATKLKLYKNNVTPSDTTVVGDLTAADFSGYSPATLTWGAASTVSGKGVAVAEDVTFSASSGSQTVYGIYVTKTDGTLLWAEKFATAKTVDVDNPLTITCKFSIASEN